MKNNIIILILIILFFDSAIYANDQHGLEERLTNLELQSITRKLNMNFEMNNLGAYFKNQNVQESNSDYKATHFKSNIRLKINGEINNFFQAYLTLQMNFLFNDDLQTNTAISKDRVNPVTGSRPFLRTGYFNWHFLSPHLTFSLGRLPTTDGPPEHLRKGVSRQGTYPTLAYNLPMDGMALTWHIDQLIKHKNSITARLIYFPGSITSGSDPQVGSKLKRDDPITRSDNHEGLSLMLEYESLCANKFASKFLGILQYIYFTLGSFKPYKQIGGLSSSTDGNIYEISADNSKLSNVQYLTLYQEIQNILRTPVDIYMSYMRSIHRARSQLTATEITTNTPFPIGSFIADEKVNGDRYLLGARYNFKKWKVGTEFWLSTGYLLPNDLYTDEMVSLGQIVGNVSHTYLNYFMYNKKLILKLGYFHYLERKRFDGTSLDESGQRVQSVYTGLWFSI